MCEDKDIPPITIEQPFSDKPPVSPRRSSRRVSQGERNHIYVYVLQKILLFILTCYSLQITFIPYLLEKMCDSHPGTTQDIYEQSSARRSTRLAAQAAKAKMSIMEEFSSK